MSYSIIFETKIVNLDDGRILHLDLSGCNNDERGRDRGDFSGKIYTKKEFQKFIDSFKSDDNTDGNDLKIGQKWRSWNDYAKHLERMLKRAISWEQLSKDRLCEATVFDGVKGYYKDSNEEVFLSPEEWNEICYKVWNNEIDFVGRRQYHYSKDIKEIVELLDNNKPISFYIGRKYRR